MEYTDDYNLKIQEIEELKKAVKVKRLNEDLLEHLTATVSWIIRNCEKNNIPIPNKHTISRSITRAYEYLDKIPYADQPQGNRENNYRRGNSANICKPCWNGGHPELCDDEKCDTPNSKKFWDSVMN